MGRTITSSSPNFAHGPTPDLGTLNLGTSEGVNSWNPETLLKCLVCWDCGILKLWNSNVASLEPKKSGTVCDSGNRTLECWNLATFDPNLATLEPSPWNPRTFKPWNSWKDLGTLEPLAPPWKCETLTLKV